MGKVNDKSYENRGMGDDLLGAFSFEHGKDLNFDGTFNCNFDKNPEETDLKGWGPELGWEQQARPASPGGSSTTSPPGSPAASTIDNRLEALKATTTTTIDIFVYRYWYIHPYIERGLITY